MYRADENEENSLKLSKVSELKEILRYHSVHDFATGNFDPEKVSFKTIESIWFLFVYSLKGRLNICII